MFYCGRFKLGDLCRHRPVGDLAAQPPAAVPNVRFYVDHVVRGDGNVNFADAAERIGKLISANPALAQVYLKPHELRAMFDLAADFRNVAERNPRIGQLPVSSVTYVEPPLKYHPCGHGCLTALRYPGPGRSFLMSSTASWKPHGRPL